MGDRAVGEILPPDLPVSQLTDVIQHDDPVNVPVVFDCFRLQKVIEAPDLPLIGIQGMLRTGIDQVLVFQEFFQQRLHVTTAFLSRQ